MVRVISIAGKMISVTPDQEARWPHLEAEARSAADQLGEGDTPLILFKTDTGISGAIPVSSRVPVEFLDVEQASDLFGALVSAEPNRVSTILVEDE